MHARIFHARGTRAEKRVITIAIRSRERISVKGCKRNSSLRCVFGVCVFRSVLKSLFLQLDSRYSILYNFYSKKRFKREFYSTISLLPIIILLLLNILKSEIN